MAGPTQYLREHVIDPITHRRDSADPRGAPTLLHPVDYSARTGYRRPPTAYRRAQVIAPSMVARGLGPGCAVVLEVPGRTSGVMRRTTLVRVDLDGEQYLVSLAGDSGWVRNVRAAGGRAVLGRRQRRAVTLVEVPLSERAPVIRAYLLRAGRHAGESAVTNEARYYFGVSADPSLEEIARVVTYYPVFRVVPGWTAARA